MNDGRIEARDYWLDESGSIHFLEAKALLCASDAFKSRIRNSRVDVHTSYDAPSRRHSDLDCTLSGKENVWSADL